jgi:5-formyltetrahydrofolate cyclo-ligase
MDVDIDPRLHAELVQRAKKQIRARMKALRSGHPAAALAERSRAIVERLRVHPSIVEARSVALFWPQMERGEVDLRRLDAELRKRGAVLYYPFMEPRPDGGYSTGFRRASSPVDLADRGRGFHEPAPEGALAGPGDIDVVVVPALAVDVRGHRIGYGVGYYDATLADVCPPAQTVIVAYHFQMLAELPVEQHDVACDFVVTDEQSY